MSDINAASAEPAYITKLALTRLPFINVSDSTAFFDGRHLKQRRLLLVHLLRSTSTPIVLSAEEGRGKTSLLRAIQENASSDIRFYFWSSQQDESEQLQRIWSSLVAETLPSTDVDRLKELLKQRLVALRRLNIVPVLLIDDHARLTEDDRRYLADYLSWVDDVNSPLLQAVITTVPADKVAYINAQPMDLPALDNGEIEAYLMHRLTSAGYQGETPFSRKTIQRMTKASNGNMAKLNQLAHQQLLGVQPINPNRAIESLPRLRLPNLQLKKWAPAVVLIFFVLVILNYQDEINAFFSSDQQSVLDEPEVVSGDDLATVVIGDESEKMADKSAERAAERQRLADLLAEIPQPDIQQKESVEPDSFFSEDTIDVEEIAVQSDSPSIESSSPSVESEKKEDTKLLDAVHSQAWILAQEQKKYTFQLMGSWESAEIDEFIEKHKLSGDIARFVSLRDNKPWYVLIYGIYPSKKAALQASSRWKGPMSNLPTWLRRFDSVQKQIKEKGVRP